MQDEKVNIFSQLTSNNHNCVAQENKLQKCDDFTHTHFACTLIDTIHRSKFFWFYRSNMSCRQWATRLFIICEKNEIVTGHYHKIVNLLCLWKDESGERWNAMTFMPGANNFQFKLHYTVQLTERNVLFLKRRERNKTSFQVNWTCMHVFQLLLIGDIIRVLHSQR